MAALLRQSRHILEGSRLLGTYWGSIRDVSCSSLHQAVSFSAAPSSKATRGRKKGQDQATPPKGVTGSGELGDGHSTPDKPQRSPSAFSQFRKEQFADMKAKSTGKIALGQATKDIAAKWRGLSDKEKKPYQTRAVSAKLANPPKQKATKPPGHQTGYRLFIKENFESVKARNPVLRASEVMTAMGHEWKAKSQADKDAYSAKAVEYNRTLKQAGSGMF